MPSRFIATFTAIVAAGALCACSSGDADRGEAVFNQCKYCHSVGPGAMPGVGPVQNNLVGSTAGSRPGFNYSAAMKQAGEKGLVWNEYNLDRFLENPKAVVPGTKMSFPGLKRPKDRADVIAYLGAQTGK
ncbi:MAG: c-type cytochrome [Rhodomicrobium sp.]